MTLQLDCISVHYGSIHALREVTASALSGRLTVLIGPNAAGKSTLLRCASGILPSTGCITLGGDDLAELSSSARARRIAYMPQRPRNDMPLTVQEVVELARIQLTPDHDRLQELMTGLELDSIRSRPFPALSVGQQQRVVLARTLYQLQPAGLLALDEPTAPMDPRHAAIAIEHIQQAASDGAAVLMSLHDLGHASALADDAWLLAEGQLVSTGVADSVLQPDALRSTFGIEYERLVRGDGTGWLAPAPRTV